MMTRGGNEDDNRIRMASKYSDLLHFIDVTLPNGMRLCMWIGVEDDEERNRFANELLNRLHKDAESITRDHLAAARRIVD